MSELTGVLFLMISHYKFHNLYNRDMEIDVLQH